MAGNRTEPERDNRRDASAAAGTRSAGVRGFEKAPAAKHEREDAENAPAARLVIICAFENRPQADLAKSALQAAGIPAMVRADTAGGMRPHLAAMEAGFQIVVREEDAEDAREILRPRPIIVEE